MGKFEQEYFAKHFRTIDRLIAFRKCFNKWEISHGGKGIYRQFNGPVKFFLSEERKTVDKNGKPIKWIYLTKNKVDKEIKRRLQHERSEG